MELKSILFLELRNTGLTSRMQNTRDIDKAKM